MVENKKYGLLKSDLNNVVSILNKNKKISGVILFGSRAKGNFKEGSDVDLALKGTALNLNDIIDLSLEIDQLFLPYKFDLIIFDRIKEAALIEHINRVGIVLYERMLKEA
ncbi:MAG: nucleotidyltransferase domain-containing protein [Bacteroidales bacterium]|nr:nucleotidyltransferase domain-containing protein [Bacteroidales bacterium]MCF6341445.1 nucleotidyltransferase domain-containing protein [Bacteroidales bacterium]